MPKQIVKPEEFVRAWQTSNSVDEVAEKLSIKKSTCSVRAANYRRKGVPLKLFSQNGFRGRPQYDQLAKMARELVSEEGTDATDE